MNMPEELVREKKALAQELKRTVKELISVAQDDDSMGGAEILGKIKEEVFPLLDKLKNRIEKQESDISNPDIQSILETQREVIESIIEYVEDTEPKLRNVGRAPEGSVDRMWKSNRSTVLTRLEKIKESIVGPGFIKSWFVSSSYLLEELSKEEEMTSSPD